MSAVFLLPLVAYGFDAAPPPPSQRRVGDFGRHPGQNGALTEDQLALARTAWKYFENNYQPSTCLYNSVDQYPSTTMWDTASSIAGLVSAFELGLIEAPVFDERMGCLVNSLRNLPLFRGELPNKAYHTVTLQASAYDNSPAEIGFSAIDIGRLLTWLAVVKTRYPLHADAIDRAVLRWRFCNVLDDGGSLHGAVGGSEGPITYLQEGRLGYEEYAASGFQLWGFDTSAASRREPYDTLDIERLPIDYDGRDPAEYGAHTYVVTEPYLLSGIELNWDFVTQSPESDLWTSDRKTRKQSDLVYKAQERRWRDTGILTARSEHHVDAAPWFVYDTVYSDGVAWNTISDDGEPHPDLAALSSKAAVGLDVLYDTRYTDKLVDAIAPLRDDSRGILEGLYEQGGRHIEAATANTNGIVLEALLYKVEGTLYRNPGGAYQTLWDHVPNGEFSGANQCLPASRRGHPAPIGG